MAETSLPAGARATTQAAPESKYATLLPVVAIGLACEIAIVVAHMRGQFGLDILLAAHLALMLVLSLLQWRRLRSCDDGGLALLVVIAMLATGPFAAACALLLPVFVRRDLAGEALLPEWYDRIALSSEQSEFARLSDRIAIGRAANLAAPLPLPFVELFKTGPVSEQQAALGLIARDFHPGYLPVLKMALDSAQPVIRVQAAAVAARVRGPLNALVKALFDTASNPLLTTSEAVEVAADLKAAIESGLLEAREQGTALGIREGLLARTFAHLDARHRAADERSGAVVEAHDDEADEAYAAHLLSEGRFAEFRSLRQTVRRPLHGRYRSRVVAIRPHGPLLMGRVAPLAVRR